MKIDLVGGPSLSQTATPTPIPVTTGQGVGDKQAIRSVGSRSGAGQEKQYSEEKRYSEDEVIDIIEQANNQFVAYDRKFEFSIHEKTKQIMVKVLDSVTNEVIKELPPEKVLDIVAGIWEVAGIMVDKKI